MGQRVWYDLKIQGDCNKILLHEITFQNKRENMDEIKYISTFEFQTNYVVNMFYSDKPNLSSYFE